MAVIGDGLRLFALNSSRAFGERVSQHLGIALSAHEEREFEDREHKARPLVGVRGMDVYVIHSLYADSLQSGNDKLCRLLFFIATLRDAGAVRVSAVVPYLAYARKDRQTKEFDPVTTRYVACLFEAMGTGALMTLDVHNLAAFQNAFRCPTVHLAADGLFIKYLLPLLGKGPVTVVAPDAGAIKRAERFRQGLSSALGAQVGAAFMEKYRSEGKVSGQLLVGEVRDRQVILFDDLISTGGTLLRAAQACQAHGAGEVTAIATHGVFSAQASDALADPLLHRIAVTDSTEPLRSDATAVSPRLAVVSSAALFADAITTMHYGEPEKVP